jgi:uncharacterized protein (TIGR03382 family)
MQQANMKTVACLSMILAVLAALPARAGEPQTTLDVDLAKRWKGPSVTLFVCDAEPYASTEDLLLATSLAADAWNDVGAGPRLDVAGAGPCEGKHVDVDGVSRIGFYRDAWQWPVDAAAATTVWRRSKASPIAESDIALNPSLDWSFDASDEAGAFDLWNILTHEIGHALGLPDIKDPNAASMFYVTARGETSKRDLAPEDVGMLLKLYENIDDPSPGCAAVGGQAPMVALMSLVAIALRRRR